MPGTQAPVLDGTCAKPVQLLHDAHPAGLTLYCELPYGHPIEYTSCRVTVSDDGLTSRPFYFGPRTF